MGETLGERIRRIRKERGLGLRAMARDLDVSAGYVSRIEKDAEKYPPGEDLLRKIADALGDDFDELMALAGRVSKELKEQVRQDPQMPEFLRRAREQNLSGEDLLRLLNGHKKDGD
ncbi:MAG TPA: XRE family transcriptional regulator [Polyangiaceae bacterium]|nr:XRE family transcriptional regulator [Polyangiaceae bacterium]